MTTHYQAQNYSPSSSGAENYFKTLKPLNFQTKVQKDRIDDFLQAHISYLNGEFKLAKSDLVSNNKNKTEKTKKKRMPKQPAN